MKLSPSVSIEQSESGLEFIKVASEKCDAKIFLQGGQITEFIPIILILKIFNVYI